MGKLSDILKQDLNTLQDAWQASDAAKEFAPLPNGDYIARIVGGELVTSRTNQTPGYKLTFRVLEGDYIDRQFWHEIWLTPPAMPMAKRDLGKLGVTDLAQLENPLPHGLRCSVKVVLRRADDDGTEYNSVRRFEVLSIDEPEPNPFAPKDDSTDGQDNVELEADHA